MTKTVIYALIKYPHIHNDALRFNYPLTHYDYFIKHLNDTMVLILEYY